MSSPFCDVDVCGDAGTRQRDDITAEASKAAAGAVSYQKAVPFHYPEPPQPKQAKPLGPPKMAALPPPPGQHSLRRSSEAFVGQNMNKQAGMPVVVHCLVSMAWSLGYLRQLIAN